MVMFSLGGERSGRERYCPSAMARGERAANSRLYLVRGIISLLIMLRKALVLLPNTAPFLQLSLPFYATISITPSDGVEAKVEQFLTGTMITPSVDTLHSSSISLKLQLDISSSAKRELLFGFYLHIGYLVGDLLCH